MNGPEEGLEGLDASLGRRENGPVAAGRTACWGAAAFFLILGGLVWASPVFALSLRVLLGRFVYSTSNAAMLLTLGVFAVSMLRMGTGCPPVASAARKPCSVLRALLLVLATGHLIHAVALLDWIATADGATRTAQYAWSAGEQSFMAVTHSHLGKSGLGSIAQKMGLSSVLGAYDMAGPLARFVAPLASMGMVLCCAAALVLLIAGLPEIAQRGKARLGWVSIYLLSGLSCIQLIVDGGPFALRLSLSWWVLCFVVFVKPGEGMRSLPVAWKVLAACCFVGHTVTWSILSARPYGFALVSVGPQLAAYGLLLALCRRSETTDPDGAEAEERMAPGRSWTPRKTCAVVLGIIVLAAGMNRDVQTELIPLIQPLSASARVFCVDLDAGALMQAECPSPEGQRPIDLYASRGDPLKPRDLLIVRAPAVAEDGGKLFAFASGGGPVGDAVIGGGDLFRIDGLYPAREGRGEGVLHLRRADPRLPPLGHLAGDVLDRNNRYVWLRILDGAFRRAGISEYVVVPLESSARSLARAGVPVERGQTAQASLRRRGGRTFPASVRQPRRGS